MSLKNGSKYVDLIDYYRYGLPPGGKWFFRINTLFEYVITLDYTPFLVAFDKKIKKNTSDTKKMKQGAKLMGLYRNELEFYTSILTLTKTERCFYQIIQKQTDKLYAFYIDMEWIAVLDTEHLYVKMLVDKVIRYYNEIESGDTACNMRIHVNCGSRDNKNSYHIIFRDILFESNCDSKMKTFATQLMYTDLVGENEDKDLHGKIDTMVYTKNRLFRCPENCKRGQAVSLKRINSDINSTMKNIYSENDADAWQHSNIMVEREGSRIFKYGIVRKVQQKKRNYAEVEKNDPSKKQKNRTEQENDTPSELCLPMYFKKKFVTTDTVVQRKSLIENGEYKLQKMPFIIQIMMQLKTISFSTVSAFYIQSPALCAKRFICGERHKHRGNNAIAIVCKTVDGVEFVFVKCFCAYAKTETKTDYFGVPDETWVPQEHMIKMPFGVKKTPDIEIRTKMLDLFTSDYSKFKRILKESNTHQIKWRSYLVENGWVYIPKWIGMSVI